MLSHEDHAGVSHMTAFFSRMSELFKRAAEIERTANTTILHTTTTTMKRWMPLLAIAGLLMM
jgi:hypothetical protein